MRLFAAVLLLVSLGSFAPPGRGRRQEGPTRSRGALAARAPAVADRAVGGRVAADDWEGGS